MTSAKIEFKHEWYLYNLAVLIVLSAFFFYTAFDLFWASVGWGIILGLSGLAAASPNWREVVTPETHKSFILMWSVGASLWGAYLVYDRLLLPFFRKKEI